MNVLKPHLQTTIATLVAAGKGQREIARITGIDRKTIRGYQAQFAAAQ
jgi:DNA-binding CsgD family transcriptional regulator